MPDYNTYAFYASWYFKRGKIKKIVIENGVTNIGDCAFYGCSGLTSITIPNSVTSIGYDAFRGCSGLTSITIPNSVMSIGDYAFYGCSGLTSITIPNSVTSIGEYAFQYCSVLTSITIPNSVTSIGNGVFYGTKWYENQPKGTVYAGLVLYQYKGEMPSNTTIVVKEGTKRITPRAFSGCSGLTSITIPNSVTSIGWSAFYDCSGLTSITIPNSVTIIEDCAFSGCSNLTSVTISNSVTNIGDYAFYGCSGLTSITIPNSVTSIGGWAFEGCSGLTSIICEASIPPTCGYVDDVKKSIPLYVPANSVEAYKKANGWKYFTNIQEIPYNQKIADAVVAMINAIGKVEYTDACKGKIDAANNAYTALTNDQKNLVTNIDVLTTAKQTYDNLKAAAEKLAADKAMADAVIAKITAIGKVEYTYACKDKIDEANNAYTALTNDQKNLVTNVDVLTTAKQTYDNLKAAAEKLEADKTKADPVIAKINAIGKVEYTDACKERIDDASKAYNALTDGQKALVTNLEVLTNAQQTYDDLKAAADKLAADKAVFEKYKSEIMAIIEALAKEDDSDAVKEIIRKAISNIDALEYEEVISLDDNKAKVQSFVTSVNEAVENQRIEDQKTNGIEELEFAEKYNIYDLNGRKITNSMLKSGLYIRNGKKYAK